MYLVMGWSVGACQKLDPPPSQPITPDTGSFTVLVTHCDAVSSPDCTAEIPLEGVAVYLYDNAEDLEYENRTVATRYTDADGTVFFSQLKANTWHILIRSDTLGDLTETARTQSNRSGQVVYARYIN